MWTLSSPVGSSYSRYPECNVMRIVNRPIASVPSRLQLQRHASGSCDVSSVHQTVRSWLAVTAVFDAPVYNPSVGFCFLPVCSNVVRMSLQERAHAWARTCAARPAETAALLMVVCFCVRLEDVLFLVSRDGNIKGTWAAIIVRSHDVCVMML